MIKKISVIMILLIAIIMQPVQAIIQDKEAHVLGEKERLNQIKPLIENVEILGLGESTHGTAEFSLMRNELFEFLVKEMNYRALVLESQVAEVELINKYINGLYDEDPFKLIGLMYPTFRNIQNLDFIMWAKEYNKTASEKDKIRVYGMDTQDGEDAIKNIDIFYSKIDSEGYKKLKEVQADNETFYKQVEEDLISNKEEYINKTSEREYEQALKLIDNKLNSFNHMVGGNAIRNVRMYDTVNWIKDHEEKYYGNKKIMVYAQQAYINHNKNGVFLGTKLKEKYGEKYYSISQIFYSGTFAAVLPAEYHIYEIKKSSDNNLATKINKLYESENIIYFDMNECKGNEGLFKIFNEDSTLHDYGAGALSNNDIEIGEIRIAEYFDSVIYYKETSDPLFVDRSKENVNVKELKKSIFSEISFSSIIIVGIVVFLINSYDKKRGLTSEEIKNQGIGIILRLFTVYMIIINAFGLYNIVNNISLLSYTTLEMTIVILSVVSVILGGTLLLIKNKYGFISIAIGNFIILYLEFSLGDLITSCLTTFFIGFLIYRRGSVYKVEGTIEKFKSKKKVDIPYSEN
ncbi:MAG: erythromycin esterase family protein [Clostridium sp.]